MVHFVGAGCGAPDLITLRGARLLSEADVVIYAGSLVNPELLQNVKPSCRVYDSARMTLEEVLAVMREQYDALERRGIAFDVCPGVSAFSGAAASLRTEYTLPGVSQTLVITRAAGRTAVPEREQIRALAAHGASMAFYLSAALAWELQRELEAGGCPPECPAAVVYKATWPEERILRCPVSRLAETMESSGIRKTALVLVGRFLEAEGERSCIYAPDFATEFREAKP